MLKLAFIPISLLLLMVPLAEADIAFSSDRDGTKNIYVMNDDGSDVRKGTDNTPFGPGGPIWSPGHKQFAFHRYRLGTGQITNLTEHPSNNWSMDWTPHHSLSVAAVDKLATQWGHLKAGKAANVKPPF